MPLSNHRSHFSRFGSVTPRLALIVLLAAASPILVRNMAIAANTAPDIVIADFEQPVYPPGWKTTGTAFGAGPSAGALPSQMPVSGFQGRRLVNSYLGGDSSTGTLTSPAFVLQRRYLRFLVGGGSNLAHESVTLLVNGKAVRQTTGSDSECLEAAEWDVAEFRGRQAVLQIADTGTGGWGHILIDDIVETDRSANLPTTPIGRAMAATVKAIPQAASDAERPVFHFHGPAQWMNDPNGFSFIKGVYHVFYQFNPYGSEWGNMHWGHAVSADLVNWKQLPVALWPSKDRGEEHVFSGSVYLTADGTPMAFYTSIAPSDAPRDPQIWAAVPQHPDLISWRKLDKEPIISETNSGATHIDEWRDPFLVSDHGVTYLVAGGGIARRGVVCLYQALNGPLTSWKYRGTLFQYPDSSVPNIECPNLVRVGNRWVLLISVNGQVEYFTGTANLKDCTFKTQARGVLDKGSYASQATYDQKGRCIEIAWVRPIGGPAWSGCLTLPNDLSLTAAGTLVSTPVDALKSLRATGAPAAVINAPLTGTLDLSKRISGDTLELMARIQPGTTTEIGFRLRASTDGTRAITIRYNPESKILSVPGFKDTAIAPDASGNLDLHVYLDKSLLDIYGENGTVTETGALSPRPNPADRGVQVYAKGGTARIESLTIYKLKPATFDMSGFH